MLTFRSFELISATYICKSDSKKEGEGRRNHHGSGVPLS